MILLPMVKTWQSLEWIAKLLLAPPTMLPAILSAQLNGGQSQPSNKVMYQCRNLLRPTTSKWVVLICSINLCPHIVYSSHQVKEMVVAFHYMGGKRLNGKCMEPFSHCTETKNWYVRVPQRVCHHNSGIFWKK